jgi:hypothetical protein
MHSLNFLKPFSESVVLNLVSLSGHEIVKFFMGSADPHGKTLKVMYKVFPLPPLDIFLISSALCILSSYIRQFFLKGIYHQDSEHNF